jgi:hypothetical protein
MFPIFLNQLYVAMARVIAPSLIQKSGQTNDHTFVFANTTVSPTCSICIQIYTIKIYFELLFGLVPQTFTGFF